MPENKAALLIASFAYDDPYFKPLKAPEQDVKALSRVLSDPAIGGFGDVKILVNKPKEELLLAIEEFYSDRNSQDLLLLYFSGHGIKDQDGRLYYATGNTRHNRLVSTAVPAYQVNDLIARSRSRRKILVLDCCYSGAVSKSFLAKGEATVGVMEEFKQGQGLVTLTAADAFQYAFEGNEIGDLGPYSVFTRALVEGIETGKADRDGDQFIALDELYDYAYERVERDNPNQKPRIQGEVEGRIIVARNPRPPAPAELPPELEAAIHSPFVSVREQAVQELERLVRGRNKSLALGAQAALIKLKDDDSRRVASAAERCLSAFEEAQRLTHEEAGRQAGQAAERAEAERLALARERAEQERIGREKAEAERQAAERAEAERLALERQRAEQERIAREKAETEREAAERIEAERLARKRGYQERIAREKAEAEREAAERIEAERLALERQRAEQERIAREKAETERRAEPAVRLALKREQARQEHIAREMAEAERRLTQGKAEAERTKRAIRIACGIVSAVMLIAAGVWIFGNTGTESPRNRAAESAIPESVPPQESQAKPAQEPAASLGPTKYDLVRALGGHSGEIMQVSFSPDGKVLASAGRDSKVVVWEVSGGRQIASLGQEDAFAATFSPDGRLLASAGSSAGIKLWDTGSWGEAATLGDPSRTTINLGNGSVTSERIYSLDFSPDSRLLAAAQVSRLTLYDVARRKEVPGPDVAAPLSVVFSRDGRWLATAGSAFGRSTPITVWDAGGWQRRHALRPKMEADTLAISPDGRYLASGGEDKAVSIWNLADGQLARTLPAVPGKVRSLAFSPDGHQLACGAWAAVVLWETTAWTELQRLTHEPPAGSVGKGVNSVAFSRDGRWLATAGQDRARVRLWRAAE